MQKCSISENLDNYSSLAIDIAEEIVDGLNNGDYKNFTNAINTVLDEQFFFSGDKWDLIKTYLCPEDANYSVAEEMFVNELYSIIDEDDIDEDIE